MNGGRFQYQVPDAAGPLSRAANIAVATGSIASRLVHESRSRASHPDGRSENVSEHSHMLAKVAYALACDMYPALDRGKVVQYAILHDDVEAYVGDTPTYDITAEGRRAKRDREQQGLGQLVSEWTRLVPEYAVLASLYEAQQDAEARFVRVADKLMTLLIHCADEGAMLRKHWTFASLTDLTIRTANELYDEYPEYGDLITVRTEIAMYLTRTYLMPST